MTELIKIISLYRALIWRRAVAVLRHRYAGSGFGFAWNLLHPLALIIIYSVVFGLLLKRAFPEMEVPYPVFLCSGLIPWIAFRECVARGTRVFSSNAAYLKRLPVPEEVFIAETAVTSVLQLVIGFSLVIAISLLLGNWPYWTWLLLPLPLLVLLATAFGLGMALGTLNVFFPDIGQIVQIVLRIAIWMAPILYPVAFFQEHGLEFLLAVNPATFSLIAIRDLFIRQSLPEISTILGMVSWLLAAIAIGTLTLRSLRSEIRDNI